MSLKTQVLRLSAAGLIALAMHEGFSDKPYLDQAGIWTDGFGNTNGVVPGKVVTVPQALDRLNKNLIPAQNAVNQCVTSYISDTTFASFVSFTYNVGGSAFCKSTLVKLYNQGEKFAACDQLSRWVIAGGKRNQGLVNRREKERAMCLEGLR